LRISREFELLKAALFKGGITAETLDLLVAGADSSDHRKDSGSNTNAWADDSGDHSPYQDRQSSQFNPSASIGATPWRQPGTAASFNLAPGSGPYHNGQGQSRQGASGLTVPGFCRQASYGAPPSSVPDDGAFDEVGSAADEGINLPSDATAGPPPAQERRTLYFAGLSDRTTHADLLSILKGGKLLSVNLRGERSATVTFLDGAADFLAWAKRNDLYLHAKRIDVRWAERQFRLNGHIHHKILNGATRNLLVRGALAHGLTETRIREDMEHIHNLVVIGVAYRGDDAHVSTNSVHNALFARTCMLSRAAYKGCKVEFARDGCDAPLPVPVSKTTAPPLPQASRKKKAPFANRFDVIGMDGEDDSSDEENRAPIDAGSDDEGTLDLRSRMGVSLQFLDSEGT
ncbi:hypothetical protein LTR53_013435, partial [Teratosphaeriaceae sp. CCFEE 6253]